ncbi:uncharacterized protein LOC125420615 [Ziziphus jujuba]|uniref:Uncharacterized protein LOC125420615 n=1 Tax=Ziziphus jujuba TaxID=326968 RepID=A0ABM3I8E4_ZIZJJ|nr:uncharacterized protein LOC125420615 [Ziziphus jujuba]
MQEFVYNDAEVNDHNLSTYSLEQQLWILQDQLLLGWLTTAIEVEELVDLVGLKTLRRLWTAIEGMYSCQSEVLMLQLRNKLPTTKKGSMKILDYCKKMKKIADCMCAGGFSISKKELVMCILTGLGPEYDTVRVNYTSRPPLPSLQEVKNYLSHYETTLEQQNTMAMFHSVNIVSAFNHRSTLNHNNTLTLSTSGIIPLTTMVSIQTFLTLKILVMAKLVFMREEDMMINVVEVIMEEIEVEEEVLRIASLNVRFVGLLVIWQVFVTIGIPTLEIQFFKGFMEMTICKTHKV